MPHVDLTQMFTPKERVIPTEDPLIASLFERILNLESRVNEIAPPQSIPHSSLHLFSVTVLAAERCPEEAAEIIRLAFDEAVRTSDTVLEKLLRDHFPQHLPAPEPQRALLLPRNGDRDPLRMHPVVIVGRVGEMYDVSLETQRARAFMVEPERLIFDGIEDLLREKEVLLEEKREREVLRSNRVATAAKSGVRCHYKGHGEEMGVEIFEWELNDVVNVLVGLRSGRVLPDSFDFGDRTELPDLEY